MFGYVPLGVAFGVLFSQLGYAWWYATLMAAAVYTGAAQFMAIGLLAAGAGVLEIGFTTLLLSARHVFYGLSVASRFKDTGLAKPYLVFGLTDETFSLLTGMPARDSASASAFYLRVTALNQLYWVSGCTIGALFGGGVAFDTRGLDFALTALFVVLTIEQAFAVREARPFLIALVSAAAALLVVGSQHMLVVALGIATGLLLLERGRQVWATKSI